MIDMLSLTKEERKVILFLIAVTLVGIGADFLAKKYSSVKALACPSEDILKADLNKADKEALMGAPGIGDKLSQRILEYQKQNGNFSSLEDLKNIKGITDNRYKKLKELFFVK